MDAFLWGLVAIGGGYVALITLGLLYYVFVRGDV